MQPVLLLWQGEGDSEASADMDIGGKWRIYTVASDCACRHLERFADSWIQDALSVIRPKLYNCSSCVWFLHVAISFEGEVGNVREMRWGTRVDLRNEMCLYFFFRWFPSFLWGTLSITFSLTHPIWPQVTGEPDVLTAAMLLGLDSGRHQKCVWGAEPSFSSWENDLDVSTVHGIHQKSFSITTPYFCPGKRVTSIPLHINPSPFHNSQLSNIFILLPPRKYLGSNDGGERKERWGTCCDLLASPVKEKWGKASIYSVSENSSNIF